MVAQWTFQQARKIFKNVIEGTDQLTARPANRPTNQPTDQPTDGGRLDRQCGL